MFYIGHSDLTVYSCVQAFGLISNWVQAFRIYDSLRLLYRRRLAASTRCNMKSASDSGHASLIGVAIAVGSSRGYLQILRIPEFPINLQSTDSNYYAEDAYSNHPYDYMKHDHDFPRSLQI